MASKSKYVKMNQIEHVLKRPDVYIGSTRSREVEDYMVVNSKISKGKINISPAFIRIFIEPLSNAIDNLSRSKQNGIKATKICIDIDEKTGETSFWNDGEVIPIEINENENCYNHSLIFGQLYTSSNYDDEKDRIDISGKNGIGIKATGVFSSKIIVEGVDPNQNKKLVQTWTDNLTKTNGPVITSCKLKKGYTKVTYFPDFKQFEMEGYNQDILNLFKKFAIDTAMITKIPIYFNGEEMQIKSLLDYAKLYTSSEASHLHISVKNDNDSSEIVLSSSTDNDPISFVNGIYTPLGGTHVDAWSEALYRPIVEKFNKPKKPQINIGDVKRIFKLFVVSTVNKPTFDSQSKLKLESPTVTANVQDKHIRTILKWPAIKNLEDVIYMKELAMLKKMEKKKGSRPPQNLTDANNAGTKKGRECILIIVEGESAKTYASHGIKEGVFGKSGNDWLGIYPIRGKPKNTREKSPMDISKNQEINDIIRAVGLKYNVDYTLNENFETLRYGQVLILADADVDGFHICGLIQNMFHSLFPSLLKRPKPFLTSMQTPIVRVFTNEGNLLFYDEKEFAKYEKANKKVKCKYYKGLGASTKEDIKETFGKKMVEFVEDESTNENMLKAFHKKFADVRKEWLKTYDANNTVLRWLPGNSAEIKKIGYSDFINYEFIKFSIASCDRAIPSLVDGLKETHRKVLFTCFKTNLKYTGKVLKVFQLGGLVSAKSAYHHGNQSMDDTITGMAASYVGYNNVPLLFRDGQFGSRFQGGKDAASSRYVATKLDMLTRLIFRPEDDPILTYRKDDGMSIEPEFYVPIIPMLLVNGSKGIGTGWSTNIPCYNPLDLIECIKIWLNNDGKCLVSEGDMIISVFPEIKPWYRGYTGEIVCEKEGKYTSWGRLENGNRVTELPIGMWTSDFEESLKDMIEAKKITKYKSYSDPDTVDFTIIGNEEYNLDSLGLSTTINISNMVMFDEEHNLSKFESVDKIIDSYCKVRYSYYIKRKEYQINVLEREVNLLKNKKRFLEEVRDGIIKLFKENGKTRVYIKNSEIIKILNDRKYFQDIKENFALGRDKEDEDENENEEDKEEDKEDENENENVYNYLLRMQINSITQEKIDRLTSDIEKRENELETLKNTSEKQMWLNDLEDLLKVYPAFEKSLQGGTKKKNNKNSNNK